MRSATDYSNKPDSEKRPNVILVAAMSLDGKIATRSGDSRISSRDDLKTLHRLRSQHDAVMIGIRTELLDNPLLTVRFLKGKDPIRLIIDSLARTPLDAKILKSGHSRVIIAVSRKASPSKINSLKQAGATIIQCGSSMVNLKTLLRTLYRRGVESIILEGGGTLNWSMLNDGLVDEVHVTVSPKILGGKDATTLVEGLGVPTISRAIQLQLSRVYRKGNEITLQYKVTRNE
ncbi:MAG TPA: 2,5-diamino-6-(ribosylamino)-4(3H)-pyrimidinone 5'-phosphate reductase [Candidatus Saccharimonadales bacterium]|nr:2,5-diamino-6-(ribosylamino)-4(3H)-pyrimidinone 5'-phosphate reductase [Candidatus Saccharimonadales bacterium]